MGVYTRSDSRFYQLHLERPGQKGLKEHTSIRIDAPTAEMRKDNRQLADMQYHKRMTELNRDHINPPPKPSIAFDVFAQWFRAHVLPRRRGRERETEILARLELAFRGVPLTAVTPGLVKSTWITPRLTTPTTIRKSRGAAARVVQAGPSTVNREVDVLKSVLQAAVPEHLDKSPLFGMKRVNSLTPKRRLLHEHEEARLLKVMAPDDRALFLIGEDSLVRLGDVLDLKWTDDHGRSLWIADPKVGGGFEVPVSKRTRKALDALAKDSEYIFARRRRAATERDRRGAVRQALKRYCRQVGIPYGRNHAGITFHWATRRTGATRMLTNNVDVGTVQKVGRWKTPDVVLGIYHELIDEKGLAAVESVKPRPHSRKGYAGRHKSRKSKQKRVVA